MKNIREIINKVCIENNWNLEDTYKLFLDYCKEINEIKSSYKFYNIQIENVGTLIASLNKTKNILRHKENLSYEEIEDLEKLGIKRYEKLGEIYKKTILKIQTSNKANLLGVQKVDIQR